MSAREDPQGAIQAAEIANGENEYEVCENALLEALSRVRHKKQQGGEADE